MFGDFKNAQIISQSITSNAESAKIFARPLNASTRVIPHQSSEIPGIVLVLAIILFILVYRNDFGIVGFALTERNSNQAHFCTEFFVDIDSAHRAYLILISL